MGGFFPSLPVRIPFSPGIQHWWDPFWWAFQIIVMTVLLMTFRKVAMSVDEDDAKRESEHGRKKSQK